MPDWKAIFEPSAPLLELFVRGTVTFLALMMLLRLVGQRESGGLGLSCATCGSPGARGSKSTN